MIRKLGTRKLERCFTKPPILIGGCGRSGTTLLLSILGAHPSIYAIKGETGGFTKWRDGKPAGRPDRFYRYILFRRIPRTANRWCEKTPSNVRGIGPIIEHFGEKARFIHIIRDGRDVMLSKHPSSPGKYWVEPDRWVRDVRAGLEYKDHPQVHTVKYEDLVLDFEPVIRKICAFLDEEPVEAILSWSRHTNVRRDRAWSGSVMDLHSSSIGKWEKKENRDRVEQIMGDPEVVKLLKELGYDE